MAPGDQSDLYGGRSMPTQRETPEDWKKFFEWLVKDSPVILRMFKTENTLNKVLAATTIVSAERLSPRTGKLVIKFPVLRDYLNPNGTFQGGNQTAVYDVFTSWVFTFVPGYGRQVSSSLNVSYFRPATEGEIVICECEVIQAGKQIALSRGTMRRERDGAIISTCEHHVFNPAAASTPKI